MSGHGGPRTPDIGERRMVLKLYNPHPGQQLIHDSTARFRVISCGRRFGKTLAAINELAAYSWEHTKYPSWWVSPSYNQAAQAFATCTRELSGAIAHKSSALGQMRIDWKSGGKTRFVSAERYENLRGEGVGFMVIDEAAFVDRAAWEEVLRPMLSDTMGRALLISTPKGRGNWFHELYVRGQSDEHPDFFSLQLPTSVSPYVPDSEVENARQTLPQATFDQEYLASFIADSAGVFSNVNACIYGELEPYNPRHRYVMGLDLAKHIDWTVLTVIDCDSEREFPAVTEGYPDIRRVCPHVASFTRVNTISWEAQANLVAEVAKQYNAYVLLDSTGLGDPILDLLLTKRVPAFPYHLSSQSKQRLIQNLAVALQTENVTFPAELAIVKHELEVYAYDIGATGNLKYSAPQGDHDDAVISLALAVWAATHPLWNADAVLSMSEDEIENMISPV
jgi:hypothetical protein